MFIVQRRCGLLFDWHDDALDAPFRRNHIHHRFFRHCAFAEGQIIFSDDETIRLPTRRDHRHTPRRIDENFVRCAGEWIRGEHHARCFGIDHRLNDDCHRNFLRGNFFALPEIDRTRVPRRCPHVSNRAKHIIAGNAEVRLLQTGRRRIRHIFKHARRAHGKKFGVQRLPRGLDFIDEGGGGSCVVNPRANLIGRRFQIHRVIDFRGGEARDDLFVERIGNRFAVRIGEDAKAGRHIETGVDEVAERNGFVAGGGNVRRLDFVEGFDEHQRRNSKCRKRHTCITFYFWASASFFARENRLISNSRCIAARRDDNRS